MNILVVLAVVVVFGLLRFRRAGLLMWAVAWWVGIYVLLRFGFTTPIPSSVVTLYMGIVSLAIVAYVTSSQERRDEVSGPLVRFMTEKRYTPLLGAAVIAIPALAAANVYVQMNVPLRAAALLAHGPSRPRRPRSRCTTRRSTSTPADNPFRALETIEPGGVPQARRERAPDLLPELRLLPRRRPGAATACSCTGSIRSRPTSPTATRSPNLRDTFLFWRIAKGGPGLPEEGGPWDSAMPAWEKFLTEEEMWEVILFLYDFTGERPRAKEEAHQ